MFLELKCMFWICLQFANFFMLVVENHIFSFLRVEVKIDLNTLFYKLNAILTLICNIKMLQLINFLCIMIIHKGKAKEI